MLAAKKFWILKKQLILVSVIDTDAVLGNHDYTGNPLAQLEPAIRNVDSRYTAIAKSFIVNSGNQDHTHDDNCLLVKNLLLSSQLYKRKDG